MLTILNDPTGITGLRRVPLDYGITLQANIERHLDGGADAELRINGLSVDPLTDARLDKLPGKSDAVTVALRPRGFDPITWAYIAVALLYVVTLTQNRGGASSDTGAGKDSPNNKLTGQRNIARAYQAIPDVYGYRRVWPDLIQSSIVEYVDQIKYVTEWLCISRGAGTCTDVQYAESPIGDIDGSSFELFEPVPVDGYPEFGSTTINDVYETFASDEVNGQELPYKAPVLTKGGSFNAVAAATTFTVTILDGADLDPLKGLVPAGTARVAFSWGGGPSTFDETCTVLSFSVSSPNVTFTFSSSAWAANEAAGTTFTIEPNGYSTAGPFTLPIDGSQIWWSTVFLRGLIGSVTIRAEWWRIDGSGTEIGGTRQSQDNVYTANTFDQRFYTTKVTPSGGFGRYRVQFERRTVQLNAQGADVAKLEELYAVRYSPTKTLPGVTVMRVTTQATLSATGFSDRKFNLRWARKVRTLTEATLGATRNFARIMAHIWTVAGNAMSEIDAAALIAINAQHGENSPLLRFDGSLDDADMSLGERMQFVAYMARCTIWRDGTQWTATREQAKSVVELQLDYRNLAAGGESLIAYSAHMPASNDGVEIEYVDEQTQAKKSYVRLNISSGMPVLGISQNPRKIRLPGCATLAQAENRAQLEARRLIYQRISVSDTALADASSLGIGSLVRWIDPSDFGGDDLQAGEILSIVGDTITTSEALDFRSESSGRILFTGSDGRHIGAPIACFPAATGVQLAEVPAGLFLAGGEKQCGSRYAFGTGLTSIELEAAGLYIATEIKPGADGTVNLSLSCYDERLFQGDT